MTAETNLWRRESESKTLRSEIHELIKLIWNKETLPRQWKVNCHAYSHLKKSYNKLLCFHRDPRSAFL
jgi:hypothetical protein